jgi:hypothetical protein
MELQKKSKFSKLVHTVPEKIGRDTTTGEAAINHRKDGSLLSPANKVDGSEVNLLWP